MSSTAAYRGRFAPSPTGDLHFGSLVAAVASFADARHADGSWLVRIDDVDETRTRPGAEAQILSTLAAFGMVSDEPPQRQSDRKARYAAALEQLREARRTYPCTCSRKAVAESPLRGPEGPIYPGTCRDRPPWDADQAAWRLRITDSAITIEDRIAGTLRQDLATEVGDFVIHRRDGYFAYQLAVVIDDADQRITDVVRGADLLWSTPRQVALQAALGLERVRYAHVPLVYDAAGRKLSKRDADHPVDADNPLPALRAAWRFLQQTEPKTGLRSPKDFWQFAIAEWEIQRLSAGQALTP